MSASLTQPVGQKRLTNVSVVSLKKGGQKFEIACYRNKVISWRQRVEKDIDEVLQAPTVFMNVSKGLLANSDDLLRVFQTSDHMEVCKIILEKGAYNMSDKERESQQSSAILGIATIICEKTVNPNSNRPYPLSTIMSTLKDISFNPNPTKSAKQQALTAISQFKEIIPIERAKMKLSLSCIEEEIIK